MGAASNHLTYYPAEGFEMQMQVVSYGMGPGYVMLGELPSNGRLAVRAYGAIRRNQRPHSFQTRRSEHFRGTCGKESLIIAGFPLGSRNQLIIYYKFVSIVFTGGVTVKQRT